MNVSLRRPSQQEYDAWSDAEVEGYIADIVASESMSRAAAEIKGRRETKETLPNGIDTPGHLIFRVEADGEPVGWLWLALRDPRSDADVGFIYNIVVEEAHRGRGIGRATMELAEQEALRHGLHAIALNVFGQNAVARSLYTSLGYRETSVQMRKELAREAITHEH